MSGWRACVLAALVTAEFIGLILLYQFSDDPACAQIGPRLVCDFLRSLLARSMVAMLALGLFVWVRPPAPIDRALQQAVPVSPSARIPVSVILQSRALARFLADCAPWAGWPMLLHLTGLALILYPLTILKAAGTQDFVLGLFLPWTVGVLFAATGALLWLMPLRSWVAWLRREGPTAMLVVGVAGTLPEVAAAIQPLWHWDALRSFTFAAVHLLLSFVASDVYVDDRSHVIGLGDFYASIGQPCSGLEGMVLVTAFTSLYAVLFRNQLRFPHYWVVVLPFGLAMSLVLNILRISALVLIGARISPDVAVNGFHSHAGWMFFTLLALGMIGLVHAIPALRSEPVPAAGPRLRQDWTAARILPFTVFLISGTIGAALAPHPDLAFPFRAVAMLIALGCFLDCYRRIAWTRDPVAIAFGAAVGVLWIVTAPVDHGDGAVLDKALASLGAWGLTVWVILRVLGTTLLVPVVEELFFRGYLLARIDFGGRIGLAFATIMSSALFAVLHERWVEGWLAGVGFACMMIRRNRLGDAIVAHVVANGVVAVWAAPRQDWTSI